MARSHAATNRTTAGQLVRRGAAILIGTALTWAFAATAASAAWADSEELTSLRANCGTATATLQQADTATLQQADTATLTSGEMARQSAQLATGKRINDDTRTDTRTDTPTDTRTDTRTAQPCEESDACTDDLTRIKDADMATERDVEPQQVLQLLGGEEPAQRSRIADHAADPASQDAEGSSADESDGQSDQQRLQRRENTLNRAQSPEEEGNADQCGRLSEPTRTMTLPSPTPADPNQPESSEPSAGEEPALYIEVQAAAAPAPEAAAVKAAAKAASKHAKAESNHAKAANKHAKKAAPTKDQALEVAANTQQAGALAYTGISTLQLFVLSLLLLGSGIPLAALARRRTA